MIPEEPLLSVEVSVDYWSRYTIDAIVYSKDPVVFTDIYIGLPKGFYLDIWSSIATNDRNPYGNEVDYSVGWAGTLDRLGFSKLSLDANLAYYDLANVGVFGEDIVQLSLKLSQTFTTEECGVFTPFFEYEEVFAVDWPGVEGGSLFTLGVEHSINVFGIESLTLGQAFQVVYDSGAAGSDEGFVAEYRTGLSWQVNDWLVVRPIQLQVPIGLSHMEGRDYRPAVGFGISLGF